MTKLVNPYAYKIALILVNKMLSGTRFFKLKNQILNRVGIEIGKGSKIVGPISLSRAAKLKIGENTWIGENFVIHGNGSVVIGNECDIAPEVTFLTGSHKIGDSSRRAGKGISFNSSLGDGNWIGAKSTFINGASIGNSNIVGAQSLVTKDFEDNILLVGSPATKKKRL